MYIVVYFSLSVLFAITGVRLRKKLNHYYEDIYEKQRTSVINSSLFSILDNNWNEHLITGSGFPCIEILCIDSAV